MICILVRDFAVTQEKALNPALSSAPLVLVEAGKYRSRVIAMDTTCRAMGVTVGMTIHQAQSMCPSAKILPVDEARYRRLFHDMALNLLDITDRIEAEYQPTSAVWYSDDDLILPHLLESIHNQTGIIAQVGMAQTKFPARVASAMVQVGEKLIVLPDKEAEFLAPYPVTLLPLDKSMKRRLPLLGINTLGQLASLPRIAVWEQFGKHGRWLHDLANGKDIRPLSPFKAPLSLRQYQIFDDGITDRLILHQLLEKLSLKLISALDGQVAGAITLILRMEDKSLLEHQRQPHEAVRDGLYLLRLLTQMLDSLPVYCAIESVEVRLDEIQQRKPVQLSLFEPKAPVQKLDAVLPEWARRHRDAQFYRLALTGDEHLPERIVDRQKVSSA